MDTPYIIDEKDPKWAILGKILAIVASRRVKEVMAKQGITHVNMAIIHSAITYSIAGYSANTKVLVEKVINRQGIEIPFLILVLEIANLFLSSRLSELEDELANILFDCPQYNLEESRTEEDWFKTVGENLAYIGDQLVALAFANFLHYMRTGKGELVKAALNYLVRAAKAYSFVGEHQSYHLAIILRAYFDKIAEDSPQQLLPTVLNERLDENWRSYIRSLVSANSQ